ncbi:hypothetical protein ABL78_3612 [Leptomonas seymouri]|uniref:Uncharacterized protein n=1 Tax=Leptomonas seymouri TaxID=5684 RepID=A0A0N0P685_LEPSE|nr:hypothetical protein ABL78_3612 [Leptomonas seymouri]|eukprot:KPI87329.1 hypothetical protein ABL78_3612 [Leptomonas seymouri]
MCSLEAEHQPVEEHVESAPADENTNNEEQQLVSPDGELQDEAQPEQIDEQSANAADGVAVDENGEVKEDVLAEENLTDPSVFKMAVREVDECYMSVIRGLNAFSQDDEEVYGNAVEICNDIIAVEQNLFSEAPSYVIDYIASYRTKTDKYNSSVQPRLTFPTAEGTPRSWEERRAYVDPGVPLMLPFDVERFKKTHPELAQSEGTYHDLFYGDGSKVAFEPPADNKRKAIEEEQKKAYHPAKKAPLSFEPLQKKPMRVSADFVPSCAEVKSPRPTNHTKPATKAQPKNGTRNSAKKP